MRNEALTHLKIPLESWQKMIIFIKKVWVADELGDLPIEADRLLADLGVFNA